MNRSVLRGTVLIALAVGVIAAMIALPGSSPRPKPIHPPNNDPWVLVNYDPNTQYGTYLGNGLISTKIMGDGVGSACYMAGLYNNDAITPAPNWSNLRFYDGKTEFKIDKEAPYRQTLDMKTGILTTEATWKAESKALTGTIQIIISRANPSIGLVKANFTPSFDGKIHTEYPPVGPSPSSSTYTGQRVYRLSTVLPLAAPAQGLDVHRGTPFEVSSWTLFTRDIAARDGHDKAYEAAVNNPAKFIADHKAAMAKLWQHDIIIDGAAQDQQAVHACMFYLMQSVREGSDWSIPPMGLSSQGYQGHIFWDADVWMFPALILQHPEMARSIVDYRFKTLSGAMANAKADGYQGAQYAWESAVTGKECTPPGLVYRNERHINGDVALAQWQYYLATGDLKWLKTRGYPVIKATADWWVSKAKYVPAKKRYEILQVVPPDENAELVNNSAYTNAIAKMNLRIAIQTARLAGSPANPKWADVADKLYVPFDANTKRFIAFDNYRGEVAKQADTELLAYPLQFELDGVDMAPIYKNTLEYYGPKIHKNGPAMISSAHSVIAARLRLTDKAYSDFQKSYQPYFREPFNLFNEKMTRTFDNTCFLTGAAGPIQAAIFGLAGARMDYFPTDPTNAELRFLPCLPKQWKSLKITGVQWRGKTFDVTIKKGNQVTVVPKTSGG